MRSRLCEALATIATEPGDYAKLQKTDDYAKGDSTR